MRITRVFCIVLAWLLCTPDRADAQDPFKIGPFVADVQGSFAKYGKKDALASTVGVTTQDLPGRGLGVNLAGHWYPGTWKRVTFGVGGSFLLSRGSHGGTMPARSQTRSPDVDTTFRAFSPQLSFNFAGSNGWSYISGGLALSSLHVTPTSTATSTATRAVEADRIKTINYGGGARWFIKPRLAFSLDVRFYALSPQTDERGALVLPRMTLLVVSAGVALR